MHLQENTFIDLDCRVNVTQIVAKYPLHYMTYASVKFEVATSNGFPSTRKYSILYLTLTNVTQSFGQYPLHHVTYAPAKFEVALSNSLGGNAFTHYLTFYFRSRSHKMLLSC